MFSNSDAAISVTVLGVTLWFLWPFIMRFSHWWTTFNSIPGLGAIQNFKLLWRVTFAKDLKELNDIGRSTLDPLFKIYPVFSFWLGPIPLIILPKAVAAKILLSSHTQLEKAFVYKLFRNWFGDGLITSHGSKWHQRRKLLTQAFHIKILEDFKLVMNEQADILVQILDQKCQEMKGNGFDISPFISRCSLDIICETAMGHGVNSQLIQDSEYVTAIGRFLLLFIKRILKPWMYFDCIYRFSSMGKLEQHSINISHEFTNNVIKMKRKKLAESKQSEMSTRCNVSDDVGGKKRRIALLDLLLETSIEDVSNSGQPLTDEDIRDEVENFMFAGQDTTATSITCALYHIGLQPQVQQKLTDELLRIYGDSERHSASNDLTNLKYLECVIKETLRVNPPIAMVGRTLTDEINICGYTIPAGMTVIVSPYYVHRDQANYTAPDTFDPDRFLPENSLDRDPNAFIPFSAGPRNCIGQKFAMMEIKVVLAAILRRFKVTVLEPDLISDILYKVVYPKHSFGCLVQLEPRKNLST